MACEFFCPTYAGNDASLNQAVHASSSQELAELIKQDQKDRQNLTAFRDTKLYVDIKRRDISHQKRVKELVSQNQLYSADDYYNAALIMQHSSESMDYALAHILAIIALQKGKNKALLLIADTFDRFMLNVKQPQIFGSQYFGKQNQSFCVEEPYDKSVLTDEIRKFFDVPDQQKTLEFLNQMHNIQKNEINSNDRSVKKNDAKALN